MFMHHNGNHPETVPTNPDASVYAKDIQASERRKLGMFSGARGKIVEALLLVNSMVWGGAYYLEHKHFQETKQWFEKQLQNQVENAHKWDPSDLREVATNDPWTLMHDIGHNVGSILSRPDAPDLLKLVCQKEPGLILLYGNKYNRQPWAEGLMRQAAAMDPEDAVKFNSSFRDTPYWSNVLDAALEQLRHSSQESERAVAQAYDEEGKYHQ